MKSVVLALILLISAADSFAQKKKASPKNKAQPAQKKTTKAESPNELTKLRDQYISSTKEYKASLERLLALYRPDVVKAEQRLDQMRKLLEAGLVSKREVEQSERAVEDAKIKVSGVEQQMKSADTQIAQVLMEVEGDKLAAKLGKLRKGAFVSTASFIRYNGAGGWVLTQAGKIQSFFQSTFNRPLPIAVFGQGNIHNQWRLDHRNAMDISLNPDGAEGQALINFLRNNGIPFSAFRGAIPGVATGPHIHIGLPSHRY